jgi:hypothetical protein
VKIASTPPDAIDYGGSGLSNLGGIDAVPFTLTASPRPPVITLPPLAALYLQLEG